MIGGAFLASGGGGNDASNVPEHHFDGADRMSAPGTVGCGGGAKNEGTNAAGTVAGDREHVWIVEQ